MRQGIGGQTVWHLRHEDRQCYLKWAFSEAAVLFLRNNPAGQKYLARLEKKHGKGKALTVLAHKLARAVYDMLKRDVVFDIDNFLQELRERSGRA